MPRIPRNWIKTADDPKTTMVRRFAPKRQKRIEKKMCSPPQAADPQNNTLLYVMFATQLRSTIRPHTGRTYCYARPETENDYILIINYNTIVDNYITSHCIVGCSRDNY
uniref:Uncharacterized protein n=1 Tax=Schizaphis graminum TaxID=13262 RepID=A0A2S2NKC6_SCHGA